MAQVSLAKRIACGAVGGIAGTLALRGLMMARLKLAPETKAPIRTDPGAYMVDRVQDALPPELEAKVTPPIKEAAAKTLPLLYGAAAGALGAAFNPAGNISLGGSALGVGTWATGYLGWLPALKLMPPVNEHNPEQALPQVVEHAVFGLVSTAVYRILVERI